MKDILLYLPTRNKPEFLEKTLETIFSTAKDQNCFDILCHVDLDQIDLYKKIIDKYPNIIWRHLEFCQDSWFSMMKDHHDFINKNNYYFHWNISDDSVKNNLNDHWDDFIIKTKKTFDDDLFALYTNCSIWGRDKNTHENCYYIHNSDMLNASLILNKNEMLPIWTYKFMEFMWEIMKTENYTSSRELITASIIYKLYKDFNLNRNVFVNIVYTEMSKIEGVDDRSALVKNKDGLSRDDSFFNLVKNNFNDIMPTVQKMYYYIEEFKENKSL